MTFCGQCGFLLPPGASKCPRCGAVTQNNQSTGESHTNDATIETHWDGLQQQYQTQPESSSAGKGAGAALTGVSHHNAPTQDARTPFHGMHTPLPESPQGPLHLGPAQQAAGGFHTAYGADPGANDDFALGAGTLPGRQRARQSGKAGLVLGLLAVLLILVGTVSLFVFGPERILGLLGGGGVPGGVTPGASPSVEPSAPASPEEQAKAVLIRYYTDINNKHYQDAYNLWVKRSDTPSFETFAKGYAHTQQVNTDFGTITQQADGSYKLNVTLTATEDTQSGTGTQQSTYQGYYIVVKQSDGSWLIDKGILQKVP